MAKDKKTILVYADWINIFKKLSDEEAGRLIKHFFEYVNDLNPQAPDRLTDIIFEPIKQQLKRDLKSYEAICLKNRDNAFMRWNKTDATASDRMRSDANHADKDKDKDTDNDKEKSNDAEASAKNNFLLRIISCFQEEYLQERGSEYHLLAIGKERAAAGKILAEFKKKFPADNSDQIIAHMRGYFAKCVTISDQWLYDNMSLPIIVSKFNEIKTILTNGKHKKDNGATPEQILGAVNEYFPIQGFPGKR